jgi:hypothetical protein
MKQEKVIKQLKQNDNYVRYRGVQRQSKDAKLKKNSEHRPFTLAGSFSNSQEYPRIICNAKFRCHVHESLPTFPTLNNTNLFLLL